MFNIVRKLKKDRNHKLSPYREFARVFMIFLVLMRLLNQIYHVWCFFKLDKILYQVEEMTKQKLKNPNIFVSDTRICVRNIPATMTDKELKETFIKILKDSKAKIIEVFSNECSKLFILISKFLLIINQKCRIMRDLKRVNSEGTGKSKGYAFMQFKNPQHAMQAVLATNNNPHIFSNNKVFFCLFFTCWRFMK